jgi:hypothetical protein
VVQVEQEIYLQAVLELPQLQPTHQAQAVAVAVLLPLAVTHQEMMAVLAEMAEAEAEALTTQEHQVLAATAYFIYTTKEKINGNIRNDERQ